MNEFDLLRKKTGMTIANAWMLMVSMVLIKYVTKFVLKWLASSESPPPKIYTEGEISSVSIGIFGLLIGSFWGYFINKKQIPFFTKQPLSIILWCIVITFGWFYINPILLEFFPTKHSNRPIDNTDITLKGILYVAELLLFTIFQIGIIGHGLLKNYTFTQLIFTVTALSIVMLQPQPVILIGFESLILFYIYYRTTSFQLPLLMILVGGIIENSLRGFGANIMTNYVRTYFISNEIFYYIGFVACVGLIIGGLNYIKTHTKLIEWQRPEEDESITFL